MSPDSRFTPDAAAVPIPGLRWRIPAVLLVSFLIAFFDRMNISYALPMIARDYQWTTKQVGVYGGYLISAFYLAYGLGNMVLSPWAARFGARRSLILIVILFSFFTMLSGPLGLMFSAFLVIRVLLGLSEAVHVPMMSTLIKRWFPPGERSRANALWLSGLFLSMVLAPIVIVPIISHWGWRSMYLFLGGAGLLVTLPLLFLFVYDSPGDHPGLSPAEKKYIEENQEKDPEQTGNVWKELSVLARMGNFWLAILCGSLNSMVAFGLFSWAPIYFTEGRGLAFSDLPYATSIPYAFSVVGLLFWAWLGDRTGRRLTIAALGYLAGGPVAWFAATAPTIPGVVILFCLTIFISVTWASSEYAIIQRILPHRQIALGTGIYNGLAMIIGGGLGPVIVGQVVSATGSYTAGILSLTVFFLFGGVLMLLLGFRLKY